MAMAMPHVMAHALGHGYASCDGNVMIMLYVTLYALSHGHAPCIGNVIIMLYVMLHALGHGNTANALRTGVISGRFSPRERGLGPGNLTPGTKPRAINVVVAESIAHYDYDCHYHSHYYHAHCRFRYCDALCDVLLPVMTILLGIIDGIWPQKRGPGNKPQGMNRPPNYGVGQRINSNFMAENMRYYHGA